MVVDAELHPGQVDVHIDRAPVSSSQTAFPPPWPGVGPVGGDQVGVRAPLDDPSGVEDEDLVHGSSPASRWVIITRGPSLG